MREEEWERMRAWDRYLERRYEDRKRREREPNYVPTGEGEDRFDDAICAATTGGAVALVTYGILRMMGLE